MGFSNFPRMTNSASRFATRKHKHPTLTLVLVPS
jgi:hypothetical protein